MPLTPAPRKNWLKAALVRLTSSVTAQRFLERHLQFVLELMGIGSGGSSRWSGERGLAALLTSADRTADGHLCVFDVGANKGQFLGEVLIPLLARRIDMRIHAFEPSLTAFQQLQAAYGNRPEITLNNIALGRERGEVELWADRPGSTLASLSKRRLSHFGIEVSSAEKVQITTLDDYCQQHDIDRVDLLKLDVEGHELDVLNGGAGMFRERRIGIVSFEFGGADLDSRTFFQDFWYFFRDNGGRIHRLTPSGRLLPILSYIEIYEQFRPTVFVVLPGED